MSGVANLYSSSLGGLLPMMSSTQWQLDKGSGVPVEVLPGQHVHGTTNLSRSENDSCWQCGTQVDLVYDLNMLEVMFCVPCLERGEAPHTYENLGVGD